MLLALLLVLSLGSESQSSDPGPLTIMYRVWEEQPVGTRVGRLVDDLRQRGEPGALEGFQVAEYGQALPFSIAARDGTVSTLGQLDREELCRGADLCELAFSVLYRKGGAFHFLRVRVEVMDLNDHSPTFPNSQQDVEISETAMLRMRIPLDRAVDPDAGPNGLQTYSLSINQHFALDVSVAPGGTKQAELVVIKELDREVQSSFELTLVAWDKGNPPRSGSTLVRVNILDSNDNSPMFEDSTPTVELAENTARGTIVINLKATDPDQGANGEVEYSLSKHAPLEVQRLFSVHPQSGAVTLKGPLDYEAKHSYEVDVQARDLGPNAIPSHCKLHVKLRDVNDNAPRIHVTWTLPDSPVATVSEGASEDTFLALVMVSDADSGDNGKVHAHIHPGSGPFQLKKSHGYYTIVTNGTLDREKVMEYNVTLIAQDHGDPPLSCVRHLTVHVLDENDNFPIFSKSHYRSAFKENNDPGFHVLKVEAHDVDLELSGRVSYSIRESNELGTPTASFSIHPTSGVVSVQKSLDYEESRTYSFIVEAIDQGYPPLSSTATVLIDIQDVNDNHPVIQEPMPKRGVASLSVPVNADKGEIVTELGNGAEEDSTNSPAERPPIPDGLVGFLATTIKASDPDSGLNGRLSFRITDGNPSGLFRLVDATGQLYINTTNATELIGKTFNVEIAVSDMGTPSLITRATLEVTFINLQDHLKNSSPSDRGQLSFTMMLAICLGATCLLLLLAVALVTTFCRPEKRDNRAYNCRQAESTYTRHPRRPQKDIRKADIQLVPVLRGRREDPPEDKGEAQPLSPMPLVAEEQHSERQYSMSPSSMNPTVHSKGYLDGDGTLPISHGTLPISHARTLRKPGSIELDGTLPRTPATPYRTLRKARNTSSSSSLSHTSTLKRHGNCEVQSRPEGEEVEPPLPVSQATLRRPKNTENRGRNEDQEHRQMLRNLVRLSMAAFGENSIELSSASPEVQQVSQLLSLLHQGQLQPRPNFRGNKYSHRAGRSGAQDTDWQSTKDSGHGESEAGDMDWDPGRDSPVDPLLEEGLSNLLNHADDVFGDIEDPAWMARLSLPLTTDYHENMFVPNGPPSPDAHCPVDSHDSTFSTFGKTPEKDGPLGGALLSEVSTLFEMLLTQKADAQPRPSRDVIYRLSAAYRRSLGLDGGAAATSGGASGPRNSGHPEKRSPLAQSLGQYP